MNFINNKSFKILIVDDIPKNIQIVMEILENQNYKLSFAKSAEDAIKRAKDNDIDLILLDVMMPNINGYEVCKILKSIDSTKDIPIIFLTAKTSIEDMMLGFDAGGVDYIAKPFHSAELIARVKTHLELKASRDYWKQMSIIDGLTSLYNHTYITDMIANEVKKAKINDDKLSLIMIDIDNFKKINDTCGHQTGDKVLIQVSQLLKNHLIKLDIPNAIIGRYGGEEFAILLPKIDINIAVVIANEIKELIQMQDWGVENLGVTISLGVKELSKESANELISQTDKLLYIAKNNGKNRVEC